MAKKKIKRAGIASPFFTGYIDEMPQEAKDRMKAEKPELYKNIFEKK